MRATYRLQLSPDLSFSDVRLLVPYLRDLGVSHLYLSPSLQAREGSTHGYDVVDPLHISASLGGEEQLRALALEMPIVLDIVPNHMGTSDENRWWRDPELRTKWFDVDEETGAHRRFFDIDDLAAIRQEDPEVFEVSHRKILELVRDGVIEGVRVDHPDGLADPAGYLRRLREVGVERVWVEKILHPGEPLRDWPVSGTVGYEFLNDVQGLFVNPAGESILTDLYASFAGEVRSFGEVALEAQLEQARGTFAREVERLRRVAALPGIEDGLARLPVYRTYVEPASRHIAAADREAVDAAGMDAALADALLLRADVPAEFVTRFQQTSPPVTAKGIEDTAFYRHVRLLALNEVGGDPARWSVSVDDFHAGNEERARRFPLNLLVTQTHDTKRSGDVRARIGALAGMAAEWREHVLRWREVNAPLRDDVEPNEEYLLYQTLVGAWPIDPPERLDGYLEKALREAKQRSSWIEPDEAHERRVIAFARALRTHEPFLEDFLPFCARVAEAGERSALGQLVLKLTVPGVPDVYQGDELEALSLVDPDNRRPVDWEARRRALDALRAGAAPERATRKLYAIWRLLDLRARHADAFAGAYERLAAPPDCCAFLRGSEVAVVVPTRGGPVPDVALPAGEWRDVLEPLPGVAVYERSPGGGT